MELDRVAVVYPSGNTTAVVLDRLPLGHKEALNAQVMEAWRRAAPDQPPIEQCCFLGEPVDERALARVEMFGGEFCGNATRGVVRLLTGGKAGQGLVEASGADRALSFSVEDGTVSLEMPLARAEEVAEGVLTQFSGIAQLVVTDVAMQRTTTPRALLGSLLSLDKYGLAGQPAAGVAYYDPSSTRAAFCVWVKGVNTIFDETACGTGTCAIGVALALQARRDQTVEVRQPSGQTIVTRAEYDATCDEVASARVAGEVTVLYDGKLVL